MVTKDEVKEYQDRAHALVKHKLFQTYFERFVMILGRTHQNLAYIDAFAGPWLSATENYEDTSFGRSVATIESCSISIAKTFGKRPRFRSLFIEADAERYALLQAYGESASKNTATIETRHDRFEEIVGRVSDWIGNDKAFVLVDPKGYNGLISAKALGPLINKPNVELLINYMQQFIALAVGHARKVDSSVTNSLFGSDTDGRLRSASPEAHRKNMLELFGSDFESIKDHDGQIRELALLNAYCGQLKAACELEAGQHARAMFFPVQYADKNGTKYYLVYLTHNSRGLVTFAEQSEQIHEEQADIKFLVQQERRSGNGGMDDMFSAAEVEARATTEPAIEPWIRLLESPGDQVLVDVNVWADLIEKHRVLPSSLQSGLGLLIARGQFEVEGHSARRRKNHVQWGKGEIVRRCT